MIIYIPSKMILCNISGIGITSWESMYLLKWLDYEYMISHVRKGSWLMSHLSYSKIFTQHCLKVLLCQSSSSDCVPPVEVNNFIFGNYVSEPSSPSWLKICISYILPSLLVLLLTILQISPIFIYIITLR